jgi:MFS family permease
MQTSEAIIEQAPEKPTLRLGAGLVIGVLLWAAPYVGMIMVLLPAKVGLIDAGNKVTIVATLTMMGALVALVANIGFGIASDMTRSRLGKRNPWIVVGSIGAAAGLVVVSCADTIQMIYVGWAINQLFSNAITAPMTAVIPDRVSSEYRGRFSAVFGVAGMVSMAVGQIVGSRFVLGPDAGILLFAAMLLVCGPVFLVIAPERSNAGAPRARLRPRTALRDLIPARGSRDFYLALTGKLFFVMGNYAITGFSLYILTDHMGATSEKAADVIATMSIMTLVTGLLFGAVSGPLSDRFGRRKPFVIGAAALVAIGVAIPLAVAKPEAMVIFALVAGCGTGIYNSVDQALNYDILPNPESSAKDLGILNMANTGGQILGPAMTGAIVGMSFGYGPVFVVSILILGLSAALIAPIRSAR